MVEAGLRFATASVVSSRLADDCFGPAMHKPGRLLPAANAALLLLYGIGRSLGPRSDRPGPAVRVIEMRKAIASSHGSAAIAPPREGSRRCGVVEDRFDRGAGRDRSSAMATKRMPGHGWC